MTTASAKVIIDAEDLASKKIAQAAKNVERSVKNIKDVSGKAKASTELFGTLATTLGGSQLGGYAGQLAQLTDRVSQFSEVSKAGGAGALAFKAGLASVVAVISFQVGKAFGNVIFQTEKMERAFNRTKEAAAELNAELARANDQRFANQKEDIELIRDPEKRRAEQEALFQQLNTDVQGITAQLADSTKKAEEWADAWQITGNRKAYAEEAQKQVEIDKQRLAQAKAQRDELRRELSDRKRINDQIRADNEAADKAEQEAIREKEKAANDLLAAEKAVADEAERAAQKRIDEAKRIANIRQNEIDRLKEEKILLTEGAEAAKRFSLERQGVDKESAARIAAAQAELDEMKKGANGPSSVAIGQQAVQSRLLTRGPAEKGIDKIGKNTEQTVERLDGMIRLLEKYGPRPPQLEVVG
jgi:DNA repair exonuclease SbcCD ATPase subunit